MRAHVHRHSAACSLRCVVLVGLAPRHLDKPDARAELGEQRRQEPAHDAPSAPRGRCGRHNAPCSPSTSPFEATTTPAIEGGRRCASRDTRRGVSSPAPSSTVISPVPRTSLSRSRVSRGRPPRPLLASLTGARRRRAPAGGRVPPPAAASPRSIPRAERRLTCRFIQARALCLSCSSVALTTPPPLDRRETAAPRATRPWGRGRPSQPT